MQGTSWTVAGMVLASTPEPRPRPAASCSASSRRSLGSACRFPVGHFEEYLEAGGRAGRAAGTALPERRLHALGPGRHVDVSRPSPLCLKTL